VIGAGGEREALGVDKSALEKSVLGLLRRMLETNEWLEAVAARIPSLHAALVRRLSDEATAEPAGAVVEWLARWQDHRAPFLRLDAPAPLFRLLVAGSCGAKLHAARALSHLIGAEVVEDPAEKNAAAATAAAVATAVAKAPSVSSLGVALEASRGLCGAAVTDAMAYAVGAVLGADAVRRSEALGDAALLNALAAGMLDDADAEGALWATCSLALADASSAELLATRDGVLRGVLRQLYRAGSGEVSHDLAASALAALANASTTAYDFFTSPPPPHQTAPSVPVRLATLVAEERSVSAAAALLLFLQRGGTGALHSLVAAVPPAWAASLVPLIAQTQEPATSFLAVRLLTAILHAQAPGFTEAFAGAGGIQALLPYLDLASHDELEIDIAASALWYLLDAQPHRRAFVDGGGVPRARDVALGLAARGSFHTLSASTVPASLLAWLAVTDPATIPASFPALLLLAAVFLALATFSILLSAGCIPVQRAIKRWLRQACARHAAQE
jgi:hypothetical protein